LDRKIRVGAVSYLNTKPLLHGILHSVIIREIELITDYPSRIATMLLNDEIDMGLVPVAIIPQMREYYINTDYCIGADGAVASVCLFSETSLENVERVLLDYQSRTSVELARILIHQYWKISPELIDAQKEFRHLIKGKTAGVVIGDAGLEQRRLSPFIYDLAEAWKDMTNLPFVFAAWISNKELDKDFIYRFNLANGVGVYDLAPVLDGLSNEVYDLKNYYTKNVKYQFDANMRIGLDLFLKFLKPGIF
jgi:chorismate dehydratase